MINTVGQLIELLENVPADTRIIFSEDSLYDESVYRLSPIDVVYETSLLDESEDLLNIKVAIADDEDEEESEDSEELIDQYAVAFHRNLINSENV
jgi:hypothetical protein